MASRGELVFLVEEGDESCYLCFIERLRRSFPLPLPLDSYRRPLSANLTVQTNSHRIKLRIRRTELYLLGYQMEDPKQWLESGPEDDSCEDWMKRMSRPDDHLIKGSCFWGMLYSYEELESATGGQAMDSIRIGRQQLVHAVNTLATSVCRRERARMLIVVRLMICGGWRHPPVSEYLATTFCDSLPPPPWMLDLVLSRSHESVATQWKRDEWERDKRALEVDLYAGNHNHNPGKVSLDLGSDGICHDSNPCGSGPYSVRIVSGSELAPKERSPHSCVSDGNPNSDLNGGSCKLEHDDGTLVCDLTEDSPILLLNPDEISTNRQTSNADPVLNKTSHKLIPIEDPVYLNLIEDNPFSGLFHNDIFVDHQPGEDNANPDLNESSPKLEPEDSFDPDAIKDNPFRRLVLNEILSDLHPRENCGQAEDNLSTNTTSFNSYEWSRMEVFSMHITNVCAKEPSRVYGIITVGNVIPLECLYKREIDEPECVSLGEMLLLYVRHLTVSALGQFSIGFSIMDGDCLSADPTVQTNSHQIKLRIMHSCLCLSGNQMEDHKQWLESGRADDLYEEWAKCMKGSSFLGMTCRYVKFDIAIGDMTMDSVRIGRQQLVRAVNTLATSVCYRERAQSLIVMSLMISEGWRHPGVSGYVATTFCDSLTPPPWKLDLALRRSHEPVTMLWEWDKHALEDDLYESNHYHDPGEFSLDLVYDGISHDFNPSGSGPNSVHNANGLELAPKGRNPHSCVSDGNLNSHLNESNSKLEHDDSDLGCDLTDSPILLLDSDGILTNLQTSNADPLPDESIRKLKPIEDHVYLNLIEGNPFSGLFPDDIFADLQPSKDNADPVPNESGPKLELEEDNFDPDAIKDNPLGRLDPDEIFSDPHPRENYGQTEDNSSTNTASFYSNELPWIEVFSMRITSVCAKEHSRFYGIITVGNRTPQCIYKRKMEEPEQVHLGEMLSLNVRHLKVLGDFQFSIGFSITDEGSVLCGDGWASNINKSDKPLLIDFHGEYCSVRVYYIAFSYAMQVAIEITFMDEGRKGHACVYGQISACSGYFDDYELVLFQKTAKEYINASHGEMLTLLRYVISVPTHSSLVIRAELYEHGDLSFDDVMAKVNLEFALSDQRSSDRRLSAKYGKLKVDVLLSENVY